MSTHSDSINPMSSFLKFSGISIASIIILILLNHLLFQDETTNINASKHKEATIDPKKIAENIRPIGQVTLIASSSAEANQTPRSAEEIYKTTCAVCHLTGVANAPKMADKAAWEPRISAGLASLITNATNGKGAMPPRGGKADLSDEELKATILYMTNLVGFNLGESTVKPAPIPTPIVTPEAPAAVITPEAPAPVITPEAFSSPEAIEIPTTLTPEEVAMVKSETALTAPTQPIPLTEPIPPVFPQQPVSTM